MQLEEQLVHIILSKSWFMEALLTVRELKLSSWCIGAGVIRNIVWDHVHHFQQPTDLWDVDVAYFDPSDISVERDYKIQEQLALVFRKFHGR